MKQAYDFSNGQRGKFYRPGVELNIPVYLDRDVMKLVRNRARKAGSTVEEVVNAALRDSMRTSRGSRRASAK